MPTRRHTTVDSSDESEVEGAASFKPELGNSDVPDVDNAGSSSESSESEEGVSMRSGNKRRRLRLKREQDNDMKFPVVLKTNGQRDARNESGNSTESGEFTEGGLTRRETRRQRRARNVVRSDEEDWENNSDSSEVNSEADEDEEFEFSDGGFVVDSDDNIVKKQSSQRRRPVRDRRSSRGPGRPRNTRRSQRTAAKVESSDDDFTASDGSLAEELRELKGNSAAKRGRNYRVRAPVNYAIPPPPTVEEVARQTQREAEQIAATKSKEVKARRLFDVRGPFGGYDVHTIFELKKSELEAVVQRNIGKPKGSVVDNRGNLDPGERAANNADIDPVDVAGDVDFSMIGGLDNYIAKLKEMVSLPLLYPELYQKFGITPPRGVLFHGPPGTGKTLMARALAASHRQEKVTFYMRKGADVLSKWIGESERQLRALFEEAQANQPSIIFFDEIDGLAPVRSAKQEQHHASIVSTLLALMDGMDNRGQVVVIGATNRPDSVDPALRRPGRFDREFYFPLPDLEARKQILGIYTSKWQPPLSEKFKQEVALQTKGFGGADLRALATEATLLAIQRVYPQIYDSEAKLQVNPDSIEVRQQDFAIALERIQPSTARAAGTSLAQPLPARIEPLLRKTMIEIKERVDAVFPRESKNSQLASLFLDDPQFKQAQEIKQFAQGRIHRPRMLLRGAAGNGQAYLNKAVANMLEGVYVRELSITTIFEPGNASLSPEATIVSAISEARQRAPSCILLPRVRDWNTMPHLDALLTGLLRSLLPAEQVFVVGSSDEYPDLDEQLDDQGPALLHFFGMDIVSIELELSRPVVFEFFAPIIDFVQRNPHQCLQALELPRKSQPKLKKAEVVPQVLAQELPEQPATSSAKSVFSSADRAELRVRSQLKLKLGVILDGFRQRYRRFRKPIIDETKLVHLFDKKIECVMALEAVEEGDARDTMAVDEEIPLSDSVTVSHKIEYTGAGDDGSTNILESKAETETAEPHNSEIVEVTEEIEEADAVDEDDEDFEYVRTKDDMILEKSTGKKFHNMDLETVEDRLWNGFYCEPQQFLDDITMIYEDASVHGERERLHKASEMLANAQVAIDDISVDKPFIATCQELHKKDAQTRLNEMLPLSKKKPTIEASQQVNVKQTDLSTRESLNLNNPQDEETVSSKESPSIDAARFTGEAEVAANGKVVLGESDQTNLDPPFPEAEQNKKVHYNAALYEKFTNQLLETAQARTIDELEQLFAVLSDLAWQSRQEWDRTKMIQTMLDQLTT